MQDLPSFSHNAFEDWPAFQQELETFLNTELEADAADRVMARTRDAHSLLQFPSLTGTFTPEHAQQVRRYELFNEDFQSVQMRLLTLLIGSFMALEAPTR